MKPHILFALASSTIVTWSATADAQCQRWSNFIEPCWGVVAQSVCHDPSSWTPNQWINYNNWRYGDTAKDVCQKLIMKYNPDLLPADAAVYTMNGLTYATCFADSIDTKPDSAGTVDYVSWTGPMMLETVPVDECCSRVPNGPYKDIGFTGGPSQPGGHFTDALKQAVIAANQAMHGITTNVVKSDLWGADVSLFLPVTGNSIVLNDDPSNLVYRNVSMHAQVDHIIPRIDSKGCACGPDTKANTLLISSTRNAQMRNNCLDTTRQSILDAHTLPAP